MARLAPRHLLGAADRGGLRRRGVVLLPAAVLALNSAGAGTVGAVAPQLKPARAARATACC
jgi:hypothetical protein